MLFFEEPFTCSAMFYFKVVSFLPFNISSYYMLTTCLVHLYSKRNVSRIYFSRFRKIFPCGLERLQAARKLFRNQQLCQMMQCFRFLIYHKFQKR